MRRPRVVVYVTREHPRTGADELLVLEEDGELRVPEGDDATDAAREQAGLSTVRIVRELAAGFVHAAPDVDLPDQWEHAGLALRWEPVRAEVPLRKPQAALVHALVRKRVVAYVTRDRDGGHDLLVFDHQGMPEVPTQVPAGRIDAHETLEEGVLREVEEETGLTGVRIAGELADADEFERVFGRGAHRSWAFHAVAAAAAPDEWEHSVSGTGMDSGLVFVCRWVPLDDCPPLWGEPDPLVERLGQSIRST
jgi:8-oxo-dGTP pyrophosphatase MutT (NUDIX family)